MVGNCDCTNLRSLAVPLGGCAKEGLREFFLSSLVGALEAVGN